MAEEVSLREEDIPDSGRIVKIRGLEIGVFRVGGSYYALLNRCLHQGGPVCTGRISGTLLCRAESDWKFEWVKEGEIVVCPWHSMEYDIRTGRSLAYSGNPLRTYPVELRDGNVVVKV